MQIVSMRVWHSLSDNEWHFLDYRLIDILSLENIYHDNYWVFFYTLDFMDDWSVSLFLWGAILVLSSRSPCLMLKINLNQSSLFNLKLLVKRDSAHWRENSYNPDRLKHQGTAYDSSLTQREYGSITSIAYSSTWNITTEIN